MKIADFDVKISVSKKKEFRETAKAIIAACACRGKWTGSVNRLKAEIQRQLAYVYDETRYKFDNGKEVFTANQDTLLLEFLLENAEIGILATDEELWAIKLERLKSKTVVLKSEDDGTGYLSLKRMFLIRDKKDILDTIERRKRTARSEKTG